LFKRGRDVEGLHKSLLKKEEEKTIFVPKGPTENLPRGHGLNRALSEHRGNKINGGRGDAVWRKRKKKMEERCAIGLSQVAEMTERKLSEQPAGKIKKEVYGKTKANTPKGVFWKNGSKTTSASPWGGHSGEDKKTGGKWVRGKKRKRDRAKTERAIETEKNKANNNINTLV